MMEKKKLQIWLPLLFAITMSIGIYIGFKMRDGFPGNSFFYTEKRNTLREVMDLIKDKYVEKFDMDKLADTAIQAVLAKLDPHSVYIPAEELQMVNEEIAGNFYGIGIEYDIFNDTLNVINVLKDGPAYKAGIKTGDKFLKAGDSIIAGKKIVHDNIRKSLRGNRGSIVNILILRGSAQIKIDVKRDMIPISSVDASYMIDSSIGYIRLNKFSQQTYREFMTNLEALKKKGMTKLVFDLRGNGGGVLDEAVEIADEFLDGDKLITYTEGLHMPKKEFRCRRQGQFEKGELVVLADEGTASASEVLIGALQDWDRATIIGRRTFGKGLVQEQYDLSDKSALRLTIARYYTPAGRSIQRPYGKGTKAYYDEITDRLHDGEMYSADSVKNDTSKIFSTHAGKKIYGGGGITPDYFIASDTNRFSFVVAKIYVKGLTNDYGYKYFLKHPALPGQYKTALDFGKSFELSEEDWRSFEQSLTADSIDITAISPHDKTYLLKTLKTSIVRQLWRNEGYFEVENMNDDAVKKALQLLHK